MCCLPSFYTCLQSSEQILDQVLKVQDCDSISNTGTHDEVFSPVVYYTDRSKAVVLVLFLLFVLFFFFFFFFYMCCDASIVVTVFNSYPLCFLFISLCCDASILVTFNCCPFCFLIFLFLFYFLFFFFFFFVIKSGIGTQGEAGWL